MPAGSRFGTIIALAGFVAALAAAPQAAASKVAMVRDIAPGNVGSDPEHLATFDRRLFFSADDGTHGFELWRSDGTREGTKLVQDINPGGGSSDPMHFARDDRLLFFAADDGVHGSELWRSNGTPARTWMVRDIEPSYFGSKPRELTTVAGTLLFNAYDQTHGIELWRSDGSAAGTRLVLDIVPGDRSSYPTWLTNVAGTLFFSAYDGAPTTTYGAPAAPAAAPRSFRASSIPGTSTGSAAELCFPAPIRRTAMSSGAPIARWGPGSSATSTAAGGAQTRSGSPVSAGSSSSPPSTASTEPSFGARTAPAGGRSWFATSL
jgi:ELWxxDGT repeat protein